MRGGALTQSKLASLFSTSIPRSLTNTGVHASAPMGSDLVVRPNQYARPRNISALGARSSDGRHSSRRSHHCVGYVRRFGRSRCGGGYIAIGSPDSTTLSSSTVPTTPPTTVTTSVMTTTTLTVKPPAEGQPLVRRRGSCCCLTTGSTVFLQSILTVGWRGGAWSRVSGPGDEPFSG